MQVTFFTTQVLLIFFVNRSIFRKRFFFKYNEHNNTRRFLYIKFFTCTYVMPAEEGIESSALQLRAYRFAAELSASAFLERVCKVLPKLAFVFLHL